MRRHLVLLCLLSICLPGCATTKSSVQIETRVHKPIAESDSPDYDLTARVSFDTAGVQ